MRTVIAALKIEDLLFLLNCFFFWDDRYRSSQKNAGQERPSLPDAWSHADEGDSTQGVFAGVAKPEIPVKILAK